MASTEWRKHTLANGKEVRLCMTKDEIYASYRDAKDKDQQISILADLNSVTAGSMALYLAELGFDNGYIRNRAKNTAKKRKKPVTPNQPESYSEHPREMTSRDKLIEDTLKLISDLEDEYRLCMLIEEQNESNKKRIARSLEALSLVYKNVEEIEYGK